MKFTTTTMILSLLFASTNVAQATMRGAMQHEPAQDQDHRVLKMNMMGMDMETMAPVAPNTNKPTKSPVAPTGFPTPNTNKPTKSPVAPTGKPTKAPKTDKPTKSPVAPTGNPTKAPKTRKRQR